MEPTVRIVNEEATPSVQVCLNCKARKRKCSKTKPSCDLCRKLLLKCVYGSAGPAGPQSEIGSGAHAAGLENAQVSISKITGISDWPASAGFMAAIMGHYELGRTVSPTSPSLEMKAATMKEVLRIIVDNGATISTLFSEYFRTIGVWLPAIVSERALYRRLQSEPSIEVALLLLSIFLAVQVPSRSDGSKGFPHTTIYFATKSLLSAVVGAGSLSLDVVQASVMVVLYEAGQGMLGQARMSASFCSQMGMRFLSRRRYQQSEIMDGMDEEKLWSCIMMLDRFVNLGLPANEIHYTTSRPVGDQEKQPPCGNNDNGNGNKDDDDDDEDDSKIKLPPSPQSPPDCTTSSEAFDRCLSFRRSVDLLGHVLDYTRSLHYTRRLNPEAFTSLDDRLQALLGLSLRNSFYSWEESCESIGLLFGALFTMHKARYDLLVTKIQDQDNATQKQLASLAIHSIINMLLDISRDFNDRVAYMDIPAIPLPSTYSIYQAAMLHISFSGDRFGTEQWTADILSLRTSLVTFGQRWTIVGQLIKNIDDAWQEEKHSRVMNYGKSN